jgi:predicted DNA-binding transcriptional regulator YafY
MAKRTTARRQKPLLPSERVRRGPDAARRANQTERLARALRLLELLCGLKCHTLDGLAQELNCSTKTVRRCLHVLRAAGYEWRFDKYRKSYELISSPQFRLPITQLSNDELLGQVVAGILSSAPGLDLAAGARRTTQKLAAQLSLDAALSQAALQIVTDAERVIDVLNLSLADHSRSHDAMRAAQRALLTKRQVLADYRSPHRGRRENLRLHPYRLCLLKQAWYLIARPADSDRVRTYRIARFESLEVTGSPADVPDDFELRAYFGNAWAVYRGQQSYDVEILFTKDAAPLVQETVWHRTQRVKHHRDGRVTLLFQVDGLEEIVHWVLGWSGRAKVIKPNELRALVVEHLRSGLKLNE